jgi:hypothetical protein
MVRRVVWQKFTYVSEVLTASIIRSIMMEAVRISETSVNFYETTQRNIPEDSHLHTRRLENLKSYQISFSSYRNMMDPYSTQTLAVSVLCLLVLYSQYWPFL